MLVIPDTPLLDCMLPAECITGSFNGCSSGGIQQHSCKLTDTFKWFNDIQLGIILHVLTDVGEMRFVIDPTDKSYMHTKQSKACSVVYIVTICNSNVCLSWHWSKLLMGNISWWMKCVWACEIESDRKWVVAWLWLKGNLLLTSLHADPLYHNCSIFCSLLYEL